MNLLFCACPKAIYPFFMAEAYPDETYVPIPPLIDNVPDYSVCANDNECATVKAQHAILSTTCADIITMKVALIDIFLSLLSSGVRASFQQQCLQMPNIIFVDLFNWFVNKYGTTTTKDHDLNHQRMAANWHPLEDFDALTLCLFTGGAYSNACS